MGLNIAAILLCLASLFGVINHRVLRLQPSVGLLVLSLVMSVGLLALDRLMPHLAIPDGVRILLHPDELPRALFDGALAFMLFAGALNVEWNDLWSRKGTVLSLSTLGVLVTTVLYGLATWAILLALGAPMPLPWCIVLGAILAPTDPIAVGAVLARVGLTPTVQAVILGESLFNDGVGVVVFNSALGLATLTGATGGGHVILAFLWQTGGAVAVGLATSLIGYAFMRRVDEYRLEVTISLAIATGGYALAQAIDTSGPVTVVVSGLLIGSLGRRLAMSEITRARLTEFWEMIDELLNAVLFLVIGLEILYISFGSVPWPMLVAAAPLALVVRLIAVVATTRWLHRGNALYWRRVTVVTWGGLRGGISVALALSLKDSPWTGAVQLITYTVVVFSIIVQGLTMERLARAVKG